MNSCASIGRLRQPAKDASHLPTQLLKKIQFLLQVPFVVTQRRREPRLIVADQQRVFFGNHTLQTKGPDLLGVDQVAYDLQGAPTARYRPGEQLLASEAGNSMAQRLNPS